MSAGGLVGDSSTEAAGALADSSTEAPLISVVVSNLNGERYLPRLLDTLAAQNGVETEVIVVDRNSTDSSREILDGYPAVRVIHEPPESGLVAGYSAGAEHATHELLFFCNEDLYLDENCLVELASHIDLENGIVACDPWQWTYDGKEWIHGGIRFRRCLWHVYSPFPLRMHECTIALGEGSATPFACAGAVMFHAGAYHELGGWDTSFFLDYEDIDLFLRAWQRGWTCASVSSARVFHAVGASNGLIVGNQAMSRRRYVSHRSNVIVIAFKYFSPAVALLGILNWVTNLFLNVLLMRWRALRLDAVVLASVARRLPAVLAFRRSSRTWNRSKPGEDFFRDPRFRLDGKTLA